VRASWILVMLAVASTWAKSSETRPQGHKSAKAPAKTDAAKSAKAPAKPEKKASAATKPAAKDPDAQCQDWWARGDIASLRRKCASGFEKEPATALYWKSILATDPSVLRRTLSATHLKTIDSLDSRLLLLAGRYQFSVGEVREVGDLAWLAAKRKLKDARVDTLARLAKGR